MEARGQYHHGNLREALIDAAQELIREKGVQGLSLRGVARRAGVSQAAPYHHFKDKEALVAELCQMGFVQLAQRTAAARDSRESALEQLQEMGRAYVQFARERPALFRIMWGEQIEDKGQYVDLLEAAGDPLIQVVEVVAAGMASGEMRAGDPVDVACSAWAAVHGLSELILARSVDSPKMCEFGMTEQRLEGAVFALIIQGLAPV